MFAVSGVASILFLGGWHTGIPGLDGFLQGARDAGAASGEFNVMGYIANIIGAKVFIVKSSLLVFVQVWVRWTLPRLRIDQVMMTCLKYLLPISCALFLGATVWPLILMSSGQTTYTAPLGERTVKGMPGVAIVRAGSSDDETPVDVPSPSAPTKEGDSDDHPSDESQKSDESHSAGIDVPETPVTVGLKQSEVLR